MTTPLQRLHSLGQSIWYDNIQRRLLENGELAALIARGDIRGVTSNPTIFHNAIAKTSDYDSALVPMAWSGWDAEKIFWQMAIEDIREACDLFAALYRESEKGDGYVSLEVNPTLAHDTAGTIAQARQLWERVGRPNLMIKIPATAEGVPAIQAAIAAGINVNVTLIFSLERYRAVIDAYLAGLDERLAAGLPVDHIASVASFFVSRLDAKVDSRLHSIDSLEANALRGKAAIAYTKLAYQEFIQVFHGERFARFKVAGCRLQRPLWASTSTKDPAYPDTLYVDELVGADTVNTVPPKTLDAFRDRGTAAVTVTQGLDEARKALSGLDALGISLEKVTAELEAEGVSSFAEAFAAMLQTIDERRAAAVAELGPLVDSVQSRIADLSAKNAPARLWSHDPLLWTNDPAGQEEIRKRLGWLDLPRTSRAALAEINDFVAQIHADGIKRALLLGMGGSSLAPEVLSLIFSQERGDAPKPAIKFAILDSTDPDQVLGVAREFPPEETLYIVSSKSGGTAEVNAMFNYFWELSGGDGSHFIAITDPGTSLADLAKARSFRETFLADPTVGGRNSALSYFGLVPAALIGYDIERLLDRASWMMRQCAASGEGERNPGLTLGAILGQAALGKRDKLTFVADDSVAPLGAWLEQLIAESSGKQGKGIIVVDGEPLADPARYDQDRLFVYLRRDGNWDEAIHRLRESGHPALIFGIPEAYDLGAEFYRWEVATAFACAVLGVNSFDQPDVQDNKTRTTNKIIAYSHYSKLEQPKPNWKQKNFQAYSSLALRSGLKACLTDFLRLAGVGDYIAINAYLPRDERTSQTLQELRLAIRAKTGCATTVGFGPRFLHSTGQLHKGGPDSGLYLQITAEPREDVEIPTQKMTFGILERAQALGDYEALAARNRRILRLNLPSPDAVAQLIQALG